MYAGNEIEKYILDLISTTVLFLDDKDVYLFFWFLGTMFS
jgi:hypothetical protein